MTGASAGAMNCAADENARFLLGQFRRFAHNAEDGEAVGAAFEIEIDHAIDALKIERAVVGEGRGGDDEDAVRAFVEQGHQRGLHMVNVLEAREAFH